MGAARATHAHFKPSDGFAYDVGALDPHVGASYRLGNLYALRVNYDHTTVAPAALEVDRTDSTNVDAERRSRQVRAARARDRQRLHLFVRGRRPHAVPPDLLSQARAERDRRSAFQLSICDRFRPRAERSRRTDQHRPTARERLRAVAEERRVHARRESRPRVSRRAPRSSHTTVSTRRRSPPATSFRSAISRRSPPRWRTRSRHCTIGCASRRRCRTRAGILWQRQDGLDLRAQHR